MVTLLAWARPCFPIGSGLLRVDFSAAEGRCGSGVLGGEGKSWPAPEPESELEEFLEGQKVVGHESPPNDEPMGTPSKVVGGHESTPR